MSPSPEQRKHQQKEVQPPKETARVLHFPELPPKEKTEQKFDWNSAIQETIKRTVDQALQGIGDEYTINELKSESGIDAIKDEVVKDIVRRHPDASSPAERKILQKKIAEPLTEDPSLQEEHNKEKHAAQERLEELIDQDKQIEYRARSRATEEAIGNEIDRRIDELAKAREGVKLATQMEIASKKGEEETFTGGEAGGVARLPTREQSKEEPEAPQQKPKQTTSGFFKRLFGRGQ